MKHRTHRLRRLSAALALGVGMVGGVIGVAAGTAGATVTDYSAHIKATSVTTVPATGSGHAAGNLKIYTIEATGPNATFILTTRATTGTVDWASATVSATTGSAVLASGLGTDALHITVTRVAGKTETINVTGITYTTTTVSGTVFVKATATTTTVTTAYVFHPTTGVTNAKGPAAPPSNTEYGKLTAPVGALTVGRGSDEAAGTLAVTLKSTTSSTTAAKLEGWSTGTYVTLRVAPTGAQCAAGTHFALFTGTPKATVTAKTATTTTPKVSVTLLTTSPCSGVSRNELKLVFTNSGFFTGKNKTITVTLSGIKYNVGGGTTAGAVTVSEVADHGINDFTTTSAVNATVRTIFVTGNTPAKEISPTSLDQAISPITIAEQSDAAVSSPYVCITLDHGATFNTTASATVKVTKGNAVVTSKVTYKDASGATPSGHKATFAIFHVKTASTKETSTFQVSGLAVNASTTSGAATATVTMGTSSTNCSSDTTAVGSATAFTVGVSTTQIYGSTADATAAAALEHVFPVKGYLYENVDYSTNDYRTCPGTATYTNSTELGSPITENRSVVLATTKTYQDALSSQYLASFLKTGTLLTPTTSLNTVTLNALRSEGISHVYVVGGPLAVTTTVMAQLETTQVYNCGGTTAVTHTGKPVYMNVTRLFGTTAQETAKQVAEFVGGKGATFTFANAYTGTNAKGGNGAFNTTAGKASTHAGTGGYVETAVLASSKEFQDAEASSTLSYAMGIPLLLTTTLKLTSAASSALVDMHVKQVIVMGGPLAVTNTVVTQLEALTISVLRVAGTTYVSTAVELAKFELAGTDGTGTGLYDQYSTATTTYFYDYLDVATVARGNGFQDGIAGALVAVNADSYDVYSEVDSTYDLATGKYTFYTYFDDAPYAMPLLLTDSQFTVGAPLTTFLKSEGATSTATHKIDTLDFLGGPLSITPAEINAMETDIG